MACKASCILCARYMQKINARRYKFLIHIVSAKYNRVAKVHKLPLCVIWFFCVYAWVQYYICVLRKSILVHPVCVLIFVVIPENVKKEIMLRERFTKSVDIVLCLCLYVFFPIVSPRIHAQLLCIIMLML